MSSPVSPGRAGEARAGSHDDSPDDQEGALERVIIAGDRPRIWNQVPPKRHTPRDDLARFRVMSRPIVLLRKGVDGVVLPQNQIVREFFDFCCENLGVQKKQAIIVEDPDSPKEVGNAIKSWIENVANIPEATGSVLIPYSNTRLSAEIYSGVGSKSMQLFADDVTLEAHLGHRVALTRMDPKRPDNPSWLELHLVEEIKGVEGNTGYLCKSVDDLLRASRILADDGFTSIAIKPMTSSNGRGIMMVSNKPQNLRFYDFPHGPVSVEGKLQLDLDSDGLVKNFTVVAIGTTTVGYVEQLILGLQCVGYRYLPPGSLTEEQQKLARWSQITLDNMKPVGPITIEFLFQDGVAHCSDINPSRFGLEHSALLFFQKFGKPDLKFMCLVTTPPENLDIWTLWSRLFDHDNVNFNPGESEKGGIFPLNYLRGVSGTFMLLGSSDEHIQRLRSVLESCVSELPAAKSLEQTEIFDESVRRIWCVGPRPESLIRAQKFNLPYRFLSIVRPEKDLILIPKGLRVGDEYMKWCHEVIGIKKSQVIYTSGESYAMDDDMTDEVIAKLKSIISSSGDKWMFVPYTGVENFYKWATQFEELGVTVFADSADWLEKYGHKGILHRHIKSLDKPSVIEEIDPKIRVAKGYACDNVPELLKAYELIGVKDVIIKPNIGSAGSGIVFVTDRTQLELYDFKHGPVILEETCKIDRTPEGNILSPAHHYCKGALVGMDVDQIMVGTRYMGWKEANSSTAFKKAAFRYTAKLVEYMKPMGPGGFDYLSVGGKPVLSDINTGRFNGAHQPKLWIEAYAKGSKWICWKHKPPASLDIASFWSRLEELNMAFWPNKSTTGVFPLLYLRGRSGVFVGVSATDEELTKMLDTCSAMFAEAAAAEKFFDYDPTDTGRLIKAKTMMSGRNPRLWFQNPSKIQARAITARLPMLSRAIALLRPGLDAVILPQDQVVREFFDFACENMGLQPFQAIMVDDAETWEGGGDLWKGVANNVRDWLKTIKKSRGNKPAVLVPYSNSRSVMELFNGLEDTDMRLYADDLSSEPHLGHRVALTRMNPKDLNEPSWIEKHPVDGIEGVRPATGYLCRTVDELLRAGEALSDFKSIVIKPMAVGDGRGMLMSQNKPHNLRFYDFPHGPVSIEGKLTLDLDSDGLVKNFTVVSMGTHVIGYFVQLILGVRCAGYKYIPASALDEEQQKLAKWAQVTLDNMKPTGPVTLEFLFQDGVAYCSDVNPGRFGHEHALLQYFNGLGKPDLKFMCLVQTPPETLDIWTLWSRLFDHDNATFDSSKPENGGIFPLNYLRGVSSTFMLFGSTDEQIQGLRSVLESCMTESATPETLEHGDVFDESVRRIWCVGPRPESLLAGQRFNLPYRFLSIVRPEKDLIILPKGLPVGDEFLAFMTDVNGITEDQVIYTSGESFCMDDDMTDEVIAKLKSIISSSGDKWMFVPYTGVENFYKWATQFEELGVTVFADSAEWNEKFGHKGILHRHIKNLDEPSIIEKIDPKIRVAKGYACDNVPELLKAYELIGVRDVIIKPILGSSGSGIVFVTDRMQLELYDFKHGPVILEETCKIDRAPDGTILSPAHHYNGGALVGMDVDQIMVGTGYAGWKEAMSSTAFKKAALRYTEKLVEYMKPMGPGGFDYLSVGGKPVLSDINTGRFNGAHGPKLFVEAYAKGTKWICWKHKPPASLDVATFWRRLQERGIAFTPGESTEGVFPLLYLRGRSGMFIAVSKVEKAITNMQAAATKLLSSTQKIKSAKRVRPYLPLQNVEGSDGEDEYGSVDLMLIKNAVICAPEVIEARNLVVGGGKIVGLLTDEAAAPLESMIRAMNGTVVDANGDFVVPGLVDIHLHLCGGGGEMGFQSQTKPAEFHELVDAGLTTVVGVLGTDSITRSPETLLSKVEGLNAEGLTAYFYTGGYRIPPPTITGSVMRDVAFLNSCVGVGEIAISDHRSSHSGAASLRQIASEARIGGMLSGKAGCTYFHVGRGDGALDPLEDIVANSEVPIYNLLPTHMSRSKSLFDKGVEWVKKGGYIDLTARDKATMKMLADTCLSNKDDPNFSLERIICTSDAYGSLPSFDADGVLKSYASADPKALLRYIKTMYFEHMWSLEDALKPVTVNPARYMKFSGKGHIQVGHDADLLVLQKHTLEPRYVLAHGEVVKTPSYTKRSRFASPEHKPVPAPAPAAEPKRAKFQKPSLDDVPDHPECD